MNENFNDWFCELLFAQIWQVSLLFLMVAILHRTVAKDRPHLAHALWVLVLLKCVVPPVLSSPTSPFSLLSNGLELSTFVENDEEYSEHETLLEASKSNDLTKADFLGGSPLVVDAKLVPLDSKKVIASDLKDTTRDLSLSNSVLSSNIAGAVKRDRPYAWRNSIVLWIWGVGAAASLFIAQIRWLVFRNWMSRSEIVESPKAQKVFRDLVSQLNLSQKVQLKVLRFPVGPAVVGVFRPVILIPETMFEGVPVSRLRPVIAHELIHVRRGDLWWSMLQTLSKSILWFNPLVWWASSMVTRESERSCDEETIASLACSPSCYANSLVDVLELKHRLRVAPAVPGVRPIDITSARLERVMKLGNGCQRRTPIWIWAALLVGCCVVLPGASLAWAQQQPLKSKPGVANKLPAKQIDEPEDASSGEQPSSTEAVAPQNSQQHGTLPRAYYISDDLALKSQDMQLVDVGQLEIDSPREREVDWLLRLLEERDLKGESAENRITRILTAECLAKDAKIRGSQLSFSATASAAAKIDERLQRWNEFGLDSVILRTRFLTIPREQLAELGLDWRLGETPSLTSPNSRFVPEGANPNGFMLAELQDGTDQVVSTAYTSGDRITMLALATEGELVDMVNRLNMDSRTVLTQAPSVLLHSGQDSTTRNGQERPLVVGMKRPFDPAKPDASELQPAVKIVFDGTTIRHRPIVNVQDGSVQLVLDIRMSELVDVDEVELPISDGVKFQQPVINSSVVRSDVTIPKGKQSAVICYFDKSREGSEVAELVVVTSKIVKFENQVVLENRLPRVGATLLPTPKSRAPREPYVPHDSSIESEVDFLIMGGDSSALHVDEHQKLQSRLDKIGVSAAVSGDVQVQSIGSDEGFAIRGETLSVCSSKFPFKIKGKGTVAIRTQELQPREYSFEFKERLEAVYEDAKISSDEGVIKFELMDDSSEHCTWCLSGNVRVELKGVSLSGDRLQFSEKDGDATISLFGNARILRSVPEKDQISLSGDNLLWDITRNEFSTLPNTQTNDRR